MRDLFIKSAGVKTEAQFYDKYPTEESFFKEFPEYKQGGAVTNTGYLPDSPDRHNDFNIIPSSNITMKRVKFPIQGTDNLGNQQMMYPGQDYTFPGSHVMEVPIKRYGGNLPKAQTGFSFDPNALRNSGINGQMQQDMQNSYQHPQELQPLDYTARKVKDNNPDPSAWKTYGADIMGAGLNMVANTLTNHQNRMSDKDMAMRMGSTDALNQSVAGTRGNYTVNEGFSNPDQRVNSWFTANPYTDRGMPMAQNGGDSTPIIANINAGLSAGSVEMAVPQFSMPTATYNLTPASQPSNNQAVNFVPSSSFADYAEKAEAYIKKVNPKANITGEMLAQGAQLSQEKYNRFVPVELALAQLRQEGFLSKAKTLNKPQRTNNPFNVGNTDDGSTVTNHSVQSGVNKYYDLMAKNYLKSKTPDQLLQHFTNGKDERYASDSHYEDSLRASIAGMGHMKEGGEFNMSLAQIQFLRNSGYKIDHI